MEYAIVDIETTGGHAAANGLTEIAIFIHDGVKTDLVFESLINPEIPIPLAIVALTGIDNEMVQTAPTFKELAQQIHSLLAGRIFVAHQVNFDYSFIKHHFALCGYQWNAPKLCTVRLSRKFFPGLSSYSLGRLCQQLNIPIHQRHRARGDAEATAELFSRILEKDVQRHIPMMVKRASKEQVLPPHLPEEHIQALPHAPGVYYFRDRKGKVIYVGKAKDIKKRVTSHFSGQNPTIQRQRFLRDIHAIDFTLAGTELMAFLLEATEIRRLWPENNKAMKRFESKYAIYQYEDQRGYKRLAIDKHKKFQQAIHTFGSLNEAHLFLNKLVHEYALCPKLCSLHRVKGPCLHYLHGQCKGACVKKESPEIYNLRFDLAIEEFAQRLPSFAILDRGREAEELSCIWVERGLLYGFGYIAIEHDFSCFEAVKAQLTPQVSNDYMMHLIMAYANEHPDKVKNLRI